MTTTLKPRRTLREQSARRYEHDLARAIVEDFQVTPWLLHPPLRASSYIVQFTDARRAFQLGLASHLLPQQFPLHLIKAREMQDGRVQVSFDGLRAPYETGEATAEQGIKHPANNKPASAALESIKHEIDLLAQRKRKEPLEVQLSEINIDTLQELCKNKDVVLEIGVSSVTIH